MTTSIISLNATLIQIQRQLARIATALEEDNKIVKDISGVK